MADLSLQAAAYDNMKPENSLVMGCWWLILLLWLFLNCYFIANWCCFSSRLVRTMLWEDTSEPSKPFCFCCGQMILTLPKPTLWSTTYKPGKSLVFGSSFWHTFEPWIICCGQNFPSLDTIVECILWARKSFVKSKLSTWNIKSKLYAWNILPSPD